MKKLLIMTGVLLAVTASMASATGVDLNWDKCLANATVRVGDKAFICDDATPGDQTGNNTQFVLWGSVRTGVNIPGVLSWNAQVDLQVANPALDPWWDLNACRAGALGFAFGNFPIASEIAGCNGNLTPTNVSVGANNWAATGPNRAQLSMVVSRTTPITALATVKYALFRTVVDSRFTVLDPTDPNGYGDHVCAGCLDQACLVLNHVELDIAPTPADDGKRHFFSPELADFVTWQGGNIGGTGCPAATPTKKATWGQVKSLYR